MIFSQENIKKILLENGYLEKKDIEPAEIRAKELKKDLAHFLVESGIINKDLLGQAIAESLQVSYFDLNSNPPSSEIVLEISEDIAKKYRVVIFKKFSDKTIITSDDPTNKDLLKKGILELRKVLKTKKIEVGFSLPEDIDESFLAYRRGLDTRFTEMVASDNVVISELLSGIISDAIAFRSSDIHFEPQKDEAVIRFRIDGILHKAGSLPRNYYENILNRVKVLSNMRIDEHFNSQDGAIRFELNNEFVDLRVSVVPTIDGEKIAIRILSVYVRNFSLSEIGMSNDNRKIFEEASKKPFGMILVVGPTGSGKSTTLYSLLKELNSGKVNITTIEDPVEYKIKGINQIQVNELANLTFANGLRSIIRQDPDIILVGEIRDRETAEIAVNSALTGHLLLTTFHANDAATALPRLLDIGIEPFLLASTLEIIVSQRLVRKICEKCRYSKDYSAAQLKKMYPSAKKFFSKKETLYLGKGCPFCNNTGFYGSTAVFEIVKVTAKMKDLLMSNPTANDIWKLAYGQGSRPMFEDGLEKVKNGIISMDELLRVTKPLDL